MLSKNELKYYASLKQKKQRLSKKLFLVEGLKQTEEALRSNWRCELILYTIEFRKSNGGFFEDVNPSMRLEHLSVSDLERISDAQTPQGIISVFHQKSNEPPDDSKVRIVALENISDPGNLGTIIRTCDWFGFEQIVLDGHCADIYNPKVVRSTMGSLFNVNVFHPANFYDFIALQKSAGFHIQIADLEGISYKKTIPKEKVVVVFCSESHGPSEELVELADEKITINRHGKAESLNVASAAAIILSEMAHMGKTN